MAHFDGASELIWNGANGSSSSGSDYTNNDSPDPHLERICEQRFPSFEALQTALTATTQAIGFAVAIRRSKNQDPQTKAYRRYDLECSEGRKQPSQAVEGKRRVESRRKDCPWSAYAKLSFPDQWQLILRDHTHNHDMADNGSLLTINRTRYRTTAIDDDVWFFTQHLLMTSGDIASLISKQYKISITPQDIRNVVRRKRGEAAGDLTPIQQFLHELESQSNIT
ncbi:hypothetical protein GQ53DRAFT_744030 [Thozetella sp. PMI_491]|nr:hypothetical protein GQ53DRAFT_744030 [Thozetella sp. PMI_491]